MAIKRARQRRYAGSPRSRLLVRRGLARARQIAAVIRELEPTAEIILYGSRARGQGVQYSDWDILVLLDRPTTRERKDAVRHQLYELELETGMIISSLIYTPEEWTSARIPALPLHRAIAREGVRL